MEQTRIETIESWPEPINCIRDIQVFLGVANFYRRFIEGYSRICLPLHNLVRGKEAHRKRKLKNLRLRLKTPPKEKPFGFKRDQLKEFTLPQDAREAFQKLKKLFSSVPLLRHFDPKLKIRVEPDASGSAVAAIISQLQEDDSQWHPVAFWSRKMQASEINYDTHDAELLAIVEAFKQWRHYLEGSRYPITVMSDHANLRFFMTTKELNRRQARWAEWLRAFDFQIEHHPGKNNPADAPNCRPDYAQRFRRAFNPSYPTEQAAIRIFYCRGVGQLTLGSQACHEQAIGAWPQGLQK